MTGDCNYASVSDYIGSRPSVFETIDLVLIAQQVASGCAFLASHGVVWRDVCAKNVYLHRTYSGAPIEARIGNFEIALQLGKGKKKISLHRRETQHCLTRRMPAEALDAMKAEYYLEKTDVWMFGMFVWEMLSMVPSIRDSEWEPYGEVTTTGLKSHIMSEMLPETPARCAAKSHDTLAETLWQKASKLCLEVNPEYRAGWKVVSGALKEMAPSKTLKKKPEVETKPVNKREEADPKPNCSSKWRKFLMLLVIILAVVAFGINLATPCHSDAEAMEKFRNRESAKCGKQEVSIGEKCMVLTNRSGIWNKAKKWCEGNGYSLLRVKSLKEKNEVTKKFRSEPREVLWTSLMSNVNGEWKWNGVDHADIAGFGFGKCF